MTQKVVLDLSSVELTPSQVNKCHKNGYLVLEPFISEAACHALKARTPKLMASFEPDSVHSIFITNDQSRYTDRYFIETTDKVSFFFEEAMFDEAGILKQSLALPINKVGHGPYSKDAAFKALPLSPVWGALLRQLGLVEPHVAQSMYIFKQLRIDDEVNCH